MMETSAIGGAVAGRNDSEDEDDDPHYSPSCLWPGDNGFVETLFK